MTESDTANSSVVNRETVSDVRSILGFPHPFYRVWAHSVILVIKRLPHQRPQLGDLRVMGHSVDRALRLTLTVVAFASLARRGRGGLGFGGHGINPVYWT